MAPLDYIAEAIDEWHHYVMLLMLFVALHWVMIRRWAVGFYDPLFLLLISNALGWAIVWFMYLRGDIATRYVLSFSAAQLAFYAGFWVRQPARTHRVPDQPADPDAVVPAMTLAAAILVHVVSTLAIWSIAGIPLFRASRLGAFEGSGGWGVIERLADASALIAIFAAIYLLVQHRRFRRSRLVQAAIAWYLLSIAMSGSKGAALFVVQCVLSVVFVYTSLHRSKHRFWAGRAGRWLIGASVVFGVAVLAVQQQQQEGSNLTTAAAGFVYRIVSYGDVYLFAYPEGTIEQLEGDNPLVGMFGTFLSTFRLFPQEWLYPNIGYQFTGIVFPDLEVLAGPNPQHPVFGYHYFGLFGFVFSFLLGLVTSGAHRRFFHRRHGTFMAGLLAFLLYSVMINISVDFEYSLSKLASLVIGSFVVLLPVLLLRPRTPLAERPIPARRALAPRLPSA